MDNNYEEFFYSEDPQEIEKEKKKRSTLHSLFPNLMGGKEDRTNYVLKENNKIKEPSANTKDPTFLENDQKEFNFESWKKEHKTNNQQF